MMSVQEQKYSPKAYPGVMVSSTFSDIKEHRKEIMRILEERQLLPRAMEHDSAKPNLDVIDSSLEMVRESAAYIGVITHRYGQTPLCADRNPESLSLTELEFTEAQRLGRPILLFVMGEDHQGRKADFEQDAQKQSKLNAFRERAKRSMPGGSVDRVYATFNSLEEFKELASNAIAGLSLTSLPRADANQLGALADVQSIEQHAPRPELYGREAELAKVVKAILDARPVVIAGGPGYGKTALATAALYDEDVVDRFDRRRILVSLDESEDARSLIARLVGALGMESTGDEASLLRQLQINVAAAPLVAILDNVEGVFDAHETDANRILGLIAQTPGAHIVTTIRGAPPQVPRAETIEDLPRLESGPAKQAFLAVSGSGQCNDPDLETLIEALDGHALSIQLLAAHAVGLPKLKGLREAWEEEHAAILRRMNEGEGRLTSIRASLGLSLRSKTLSNAPLGKRLLSILAYLPAGLAEGDVSKILGDLGQVNRGRAFEAVSVLHKLKLVERRLDGRLRMLTPIRESIKLDIALMPKDKKRLIEFYLDIARLGSFVGTNTWSKYSGKVLAEVGNIDPLLKLAAHNNLNNPKLMDALTGLYQIFRCVGFVQSTSLEYCALHYLPDRMILAATCRHMLGRIAHDREDFIPAREHFVVARNLASAAGAALIEANATFGLAHVAMALSAHEDAYRAIEKAKGLYREVPGGSLGYANAMFAEGGLEARKEDRGTALEVFREVLALYEDIGNIVGTLNTITGIAVLDWPTAKPELLRAERAYRELGVTSSHAMTLVELGDCEAHAGAFDEAIAFYAEARSVAQRSGLVSSEAHTWVREGQIKRALGLGDGMNEIATGFDLYLVSFSKGDPALAGWMLLSESMLNEDSVHASVLKDQSRQVWSAIGRYDLIREWIDFSPT